MSMLPGTPQTYMPPPNRKGRGDTYTPPDYLKGSHVIGGKYTAWSDYGQGRPDFGVGAGPGTPYHEVQKTVTAPPPWAGPPKMTLPKWGGRVQLPTSNDPRITAIRKRLGWANP
jgi:hypothetical protein